MTTLSDFQVSYQLNPIVLVGGVAGTGMTPIVSLLSSADYLYGILDNSQATDISKLFGQFRVLPGGTLMNIEGAMYPVANQSVAANAMITNPLTISLEMIAPASATVTMSQRQSIITALKGMLDNHTALGGWYNVSTPTYIYQGCLLTSIIDQSDNEAGQQSQFRWIWNFYQPLLTEAQAVAAQNQAMAKVTNQTVDTANPPGSQPIASSISNPSSGLAQSAVPAASGSTAASVTPSSTTRTTTNISSVSPINPGFA